MRFSLLELSYNYRGGGLEIITGEGWRKLGRQEGEYVPFFDLD